MKQRKTRAVIEFGDFQTPRPLAMAALEVLARLGLQPKSILEPTCGQGAFVAAASAVFKDASLILGFDVNQSHLNSAESGLRAVGCIRQDRIRLGQADFFVTEWPKVLQQGEDPWLIVGNPPWVTSAELGAIESSNLPTKSNFHGRAGIEAITGKSNFDISEWMLLRYLDWLKGRTGAFAVLCKVAVARKILLYAWKHQYPLRSARMFKFDALAHFGAAVDACLFVVETTSTCNAATCDVFDSFQADTPVRSLGFSDCHLISDLNAFERSRQLLGPEARYSWRSGIKHDCSKVMELVPCRGEYMNGLGESVTLEDAFLFPMLKSSDVGNGRDGWRAVMLVTQKAVGEDTVQIRDTAPCTWKYLMAHRDLLDQRASSIYRNKPPFSIFGVGPYSFSPWKVAISGFYKKLRFLRVGPEAEGKPVVFDDTVYFLPCWSEDEAVFLEELLNSALALEFYNSMIHWDEKRPITADLLKRLSIQKLAAALGRGREYARFALHQIGPLFARRPRATT